MKRGLIYTALLTAALLIPSAGVELGKMKPVEVLMIEYRENQIILKTDTEDMGIGNTVNEAVQDLVKTTAGRIFLDTTEYLLVGEQAEEYTQEVKIWLKGNVRLCMAAGEVDLKEAGEYLHAHRPGMKLKQWQKGMKLQKLEAENGRMIINE